MKIFKSSVDNLNGIMLMIRVVVDPALAEPKRKRRLRAQLSFNLNQNVV